MPLWVGVGIILLAVVGGVGYGALHDKRITGDIVAQARPASEPGSRLPTVVEPPLPAREPQPRQVVDAKNVEAAEIAAARMALERHIAFEEALARGNAQAGVATPARPAVSPQGR